MWGQRCPRRKDLGLEAVDTHRFLEALCQEDLTFIGDCNRGKGSKPHTLKHILGFRIFPGAGLDFCHGRAIKFHFVLGRLFEVVAVF